MLLQALDDGEQSHDELRRVFDRFDVDGNGYWDREEYALFKKFLRVRRPAPTFGLGMAAHFSFGAHKRSTVSRRLA